MTQKIYLCIDLKSFYASVECVERGLDPLTDNLVVADPDRTDKTICLAITPAMKKLGVRNRCRVFEIPPSITYVMAKPRMSLYMRKSAEIYRTYLDFVAPEDIHVYSIDECFIEATPYLTLYRTDARGFARMLTKAVFDETGICATVGIGTNLFLAKVALDITAKHTADNIGWLDEEQFRRDIWFHTPITDIWQIGPGIARRLAKYGIRDLAGVAAANPETLYREFGRNAEHLIDHAWGQEPCTIAEIQSYVPETTSITNGQVLSCDYSYAEARMVMREMAEASVLELVEKGLVTERIHLGIGYAAHAYAAEGASGFSPSTRPSDVEFFDGGHGKRAVGGGQRKHQSGGSRKLDRQTNSSHYLTSALEDLFDETTLPAMPIRRITIGFADLQPESSVTPSLFDDGGEERERSLQQAMVAVRSKFGKNAMLKAASLQDKATARERNEQIGGHHA